MDERELAARTAELVRMFSAYGDKPDADRLRVYLEQLAGYPFPVLKKAIRSAINNNESAWAPSIGKIRASAIHFMRDYRELKDAEEERLLDQGRVPGALGPGE